MKEIMEELKGAPQHDMDTSIWEVIGLPPKTVWLYRFGGGVDCSVFTWMRRIAVFDVVWITFMMSFAELAEETATSDLRLLLFDAALNVAYGIGVLSQLCTSVVHLVRGEEYVEPPRIVLERMRSLTFWADAISMLGSFWKLLGGRYTGAFRLLRVWRLAPMAGHVYELHTGEYNDDNLVFSILGIALSMAMTIHFFSCAWLRP